MVEESSLAAQNSGRMDNTVTPTPTWPQYFLLDKVGLAGYGNYNDDVDDDDAFRMGGGGNKGEILKE